MPAFEELFRESRGQPVIYKGQVIQLSDCLPIASDQRMRITFESINSDWRQGVALDSDGEIQVNGQPPAKKGIALWCRTPPCEFLVRIKSKKGRCFIKNVWDVGDGVTHSWHNGAAMIVEETRNGRRYKCNDGRPDEDFNDLIFRIELLAPLSVMSSSRRVRRRNK